MHSFVDGPEKAYEPLLGDPLFSASSIQFSAENADEFTETWREKTSAAGRPWVNDMDEVGPGNIGLTSSNSDQLRREVLYPVYFSGGQIEWYFGFQGADIRTENFRTRESMYQYMRYAREFMQQHLPFWEMQPADDLLSGAIENDQVFYKKRRSVCGVFKSGEHGSNTKHRTRQLHLAMVLTPVTGEFDEATRNVSGGAIELGASPSKPQQDWVVLVKRGVDSSTTDNAEPTTDTAEPNPDSTSSESSVPTQSPEQSSESANRC